MMKRILIISLAMLFACSFWGCDGANVGDLEESSNSKMDPKNNDNALNGHDYKLDSVERAMIIEYNKLYIYSICDEIVEKLLRKNKKLEYSNELGNSYGFILTSETWDSLHYFNYHESDVSATDKGKDLLLTGRNPYKSNGIYEGLIIGHLKMEENHSTLFQAATNIFFAKEQPKVHDVEIPNHASTYSEYNMTVSFNTKDEQYIAFSVLIEGQKLVVKLDDKSR